MKDLIGVSYLIQEGLSTGTNKMKDPGIIGYADAAIIPSITFSIPSKIVESNILSESPQSMQDCPLPG